MTAEQQRRFMERFTVGDGCWEWTASRTSAGYGNLRLTDRNVYAHRASYELFVGPIPAGLQIDHLCRNRACVRPDHLEPVTQQENIRRGMGGESSRSKTHCPQGHPYDEANTRIGRRGDGTQFRLCRTCERERDRRRYARQKGMSR